jgi:pimeloyl-ACP methyl ester carboxylesterase
MRAPESSWREWGGNGPVLHFGHANGFPPGTYRRLLGQLGGEFSPVSVEARPLWSGADPGSIDDWLPLAADLAGELARRGLRRIPGVGHSLGALMTLVASAADPGLFSAVVIIDPLLLTGHRSVLWGATKRLGQAHRLPLVRGARCRRDRWPDREVVRQTLATRPMFATWHPDVVEDYVLSGTRESTDGDFELTYPKSWEARIFQVAPHDLWSHVRRVEVPALFVRGSDSDTFLPEAAARVRRELPTAEVVELPDTTHFVPMEKPEELAAVILEFLSRVH